MSNLSALQVFKDQSYLAMQERIAQEIEMFNAATNGGLVLRSAANAGDYTDTAFWKRISGLVRRRDPYATGAVSAVSIDQLLATSVKVAAGTPPVNIPTSELNYIQRNPEETAMVYGNSLAEDMMADMLNVAIGASIAATTGVTALNYDGTAAVASLPSLNNGAAKFGDRQSNIAAWLMHSKSINDILGSALANATRLFTFGTVNIFDDGFGRPLVMTDSTDLFFDNAGTDNYRQLGLTESAAVVEQNNDFYQNISETNGDENIVRTIQSEWTYNVGIKGFQWDKVNGGKAPTDAELRTQTNWDNIATSHKENGLVMVTTL